jgi:hypothetical protein
VVLPDELREFLGAVFTRQSGVCHGGVSLSGV